MGAELIPLYHPLGLTTWAKNVESCRDTMGAALGGTSVAGAPVANYTPPEQSTAQVSPSREQRSPCEEHARHVMLRCAGAQVPPAELLSASCPCSLHRSARGAGALVRRGSFCYRKEKLLGSSCP